MDAIAKNSRKIRRATWLPAVALAMVALTGARFALMGKQEPASADAIAARSYGITLEEYNHVFERGARLEKTHIATPEDLREARSEFAQKGNLFLRQCAMGMFGKLKASPEQAKEGIAMIKSFLAERNPEGNIVAVVSLKRLGDPSWKRYAEALLHGADKYVSESAAIVLRTK